MILGIVSYNEHKIGNFKPLFIASSLCDTWQPKHSPGFLLALYYKIRIVSLEFGYSSISRPSRLITKERNQDGTTKNVAHS